MAVQCPHCVADGKPEWETWIEVDRQDFKCRIFRHGCMRKPYVERGIVVQIPPHASKATCDELAATGKIIGCGKPYKLVVVQEEVDGKTQSVVRAEVCGYV